MKRRTFLQTGALAAGAATLAACGRKEEEKTASAAAPAVNTGDTYEWRMVTTWPANFPVVGTGANLLAERITAMSGGRLVVRVHGAGDVVPPFEVFDAVSGGTAEMGHGASYFWGGKSPAIQFFTTVPFGLTAAEMNAWIYSGGGQELWDSLYAGFNLKPFLAGNSGVQMSGWFNREINTVEDLQGLKIRMPGLSGEVLAAVGAVPKLMPPGEIFTSLQSGVVDAADWIGPYNDLAFGLHKVAKFYYHPGWHEPGPALEAFVNMDAYAALPADLQHIVAVACQASNNDMLAEFASKNGAALETLLSEHDVQLRRFPDAVLARLREVSAAVVADVAASDADAKRVYDSLNAFRARVGAWTRLSEIEFANARGL